MLVKQKEEFSYCLQSWTVALVATVRLQVSNIHTDQKHHNINEWKKNPSRTGELTHSSWFKKFLSCEAGQILEQVVQMVPWFKLEQLLLHDV